MLLLFENVDALDESAGETACETALQQIVKELSICGLVCSSVLTDAQLFGLPQARRRYYICGLSNSSPLLNYGEKTPRDILQTVTADYRGSLCATLPRFLP